MTDLLPCPFCGGVAALQPQQGNNPEPFAWHVIHHCENGFIRFGEGRSWTQAEAITAWNRRAAPASPSDARDTGPGKQSNPDSRS